jgi:hypothetical protein
MGAPPSSLMGDELLAALAERAKERGREPTPVDDATPRATTSGTPRPTTSPDSGTPRPTTSPDS